MVLDDILELAESPEYVSFVFTMIIIMKMNMNINMNINIIKNTFNFRYASHPKQQPGELVGFTVPEWMIEKMKVDYFVSVSVPVFVSISISAGGLFRLRLRHIVCHRLRLCLP